MDDLTNIAMRHRFSGEPHIAHDPALLRRVVLLLVLLWANAILWIRAAAI